MPYFAIYPTPVGYIKITYEYDTVLSIRTILQDDITNYGTKTVLTDKVYDQLIEYFDGSRKVFDFPYTLHGTDFQKKVWMALTEIPYGETRSYKDIATATGKPKASRAVGMANNKNPMVIVVPCHRVIGASGKLVGYAGGLSMKEYLLNLEKNTP